MMLVIGLWFSHIHTRKLVKCKNPRSTPGAAATAISNLSCILESLGSLENTGAWVTLQAIWVIWFGYRLCIEIFKGPGAV